MKRILVAIAAIMLSFFCVFERVVVSASADASSVQDFSKTSIMDDLSDMDLLGFEANEKGKPQVIRFQEYCYSEKYIFSDYYGLFIYIFNPTEKPINTKARNVANMAIAYDSDGEPCDYENVELDFCDKTDNNRYYKFEVSAREKMLSIAKSYMETHQKRRYDIAGIELVREDGKKAEDYLHQTTYYFTGYAAGCAQGTSFSDTVSTLASTKEGLETIELEVKHANYRTQEYKDNVCDELQTAYFSVPQKYFDEYGVLQKIEAEWYEYKTKPIFVTSDADAYDALYPYIGKDIGKTTSELDWRILWDQYSESVGYGSSLIYNRFNHAYNAVDNFSKDISFGDNFAGVRWGYGANLQYEPSLDWLFEKNKDLIDTVEDYNVAAKDVEKYMNWYTEKFLDQEKLGGNVQAYAEGLFAESIDEDRLGKLDEPSDKRGYVKEKIDEKSKQDVIFEKAQSWFSKLVKGTKYEEKELSPIVVLTADDLKDLNEDTFAEKYFISNEHKKAVFDYCKEEVSEGRQAVLFRFAVTDYYACEARFDKVGNGSMSSVDGYVAQETVFLDFDIISLTFRNEGGAETVIPVAANPIDIINGISPQPNQTLPVEEWDWGGLFDMLGGSFLGVLEGIVGIIGGIAVLGIIVWGIVKLIGWAFGSRRGGPDITINLSDNKGKKGGGGSG